MKYMKHGSLRDALEDAKKGKFWNDTGIAVIVCGIVLGLEFIHSQKIVHRDIKPENLLLNKRGHCVIGDLGSARFLESPSTLSANAGAIGYAAPEYLEGRECTNKIDVFSFGVVLCEILGGERWDRRDFSSKIESRMTVPERATAEARTLIQACLSEDPKARPSFQEIRAKLTRVGFKILPDVDSGAVNEFIVRVQGKAKGKGQEQFGDLPLHAGPFVDALRREARRGRVPHGMLDFSRRESSVSALGQ